MEPRVTGQIWQSSHWQQRPTAEGHLQYDAILWNKNIRYDIFLLINAHMVMVANMDLIPITIFMILWTSVEKGRFLGHEETGTY